MSPIAVYYKLRFVHLYLQFFFKIQAYTEFRCLQHCVTYLANWNVSVDDANMSQNNFMSNFMGLYNQCFPIVTNKIKSV